MALSSTTKTMAKLAANSSAPVKIVTNRSLVGTELIKYISLAEIKKSGRLVR